MLLIETVLGNLNDPAWQAQLSTANLDWLELDQWQAQKNRLRTTTQANVEIALALNRGSHLHDKDILAWNSDTQTAIIVRLALKPVMVIDLQGLDQLPSGERIRTYVELGHALGNQHWPALVKGNQVFVPLTVDEKVMSSVLKTHAFPGISYSFVPAAQVIPFLAPHEARRLFGAAQEPAHSHSENGHSY